MQSNDNPTLRPFRADDLSALLAFVGECYARAGGCGCPHPGDVAHAISNAWRGRDLDQHILLAEREGEGSALRGVLLVYGAADAAFNVIVAPEERGSPFERALFAEGIRRTQALLQRERSGEEGLTISFEVEEGLTTTSYETMDGDTPQHALPHVFGFVPDPTPTHIVTTRPLEGDIPAPKLPEGFTVRSVAGEHEAAAVAAVHNGSFTPKWTPEEYLAVMRSPGYSIEREVVAVAQDGTFAAFAIYWLDPVSRTGEFEPVGTHRDYQRRGLASALLYEGMRRMRAVGMRQAMVVHNTTNPAAKGLYRSVGFRPRCAVMNYRRPAEAPLPPSDAVTW